MRRLPSLLMIVCLVGVSVAGCASDESSDSITSTTVPAVAAESTTAAAPTTTASPLPELAQENYEGVEAADVLLVEALIAAFNAGDGAAFTAAMGAAEQVLYYNYSGLGAYDIQIDSKVQAESIEEWDHPLGCRWELRRCEPSEDLPDATECAMYRYDPIADTEMHRFPVDGVLSVATNDGVMEDVWLKYRGAVWNTLTWRFARWVTFFYPEAWDMLFTVEPTNGQFGYWDLNHSAESVSVLTERVAEWEVMTLLSQDEEFYNWVSENHPEALDVMWPAGWGGVEHTFTAEMAPFWTQVSEEYLS